MVSILLWNPSVMPLLRVKRTYRDSRRVPVNYGRRIRGLNPHAVQRTEQAGGAARFDVRELDVWIEANKG